MKKTAKPKKKVKEQLRKFLMSSEGTISIKDAIKAADEKWPKSR